MSGIKELQQLIRMIDEHRQNIGNSQYAFPLDSESRDILQRFSAAAHRIRDASFARIKELFWEELRWIERHEQVNELVSGYIWSLCYPLERDVTCTEENYIEQIKKIRSDFFTRLENFPFDKVVRSNIYQAIVERAKTAFSFQMAIMTLFYRHQRELKALEQEGKE